MIDLQNISKTFKVVRRNKGAGAAARAMFKREYDYIHAVDDISFHINEGEIVGYIGPNGAGKSTTIKIMSGILVPDSGECIIDGMCPYKERKRYVGNIGVVFGQRTQLWWDVPVSDSYDLISDIYKVPKNEYKKTLDLLVETLDLKDFINTPLRQLSLGQRMRAEIAGALIHSPKILFLDEPTIGLDAVSKLNVRNFIKTVNKEKNLIVILTTHDMNDIEALTGRVILIGKGKILHDGSMNEIKNRFDTYRILKISFEHCEQRMALDGAQILSWNNEKAEIRVDTSKTTPSKIINEISRYANILDMTSEGCPLEEVIASLYREFEI